MRQSNLAPIQICKSKRVFMLEVQCQRPLLTRRQFAIFTAFHLAIPTANGADSEGAKGAKSYELNGQGEPESFNLFACMHLT